MVTIVVILVVLACIALVAAALNRVPIWWSVGLLCLIELIKIVPIK